MLSTLLLASLLLHLGESLPIQTPTDLHSGSFSDNDQVVVYWGQNSRGKVDSQQPLAYYCSSDSVDIIVLSFMTVFFGPGGLPVINLGNACERSYFEGSNLLSCPNVGKDISQCQSRGKKILLSLGGAVGSYGFTSESQAIDFADQLWNIFGGGTSLTRPFADAIVDGFDLDIEAGSGQFYAAMVSRLKQYFDLDKSKSYYISAAPQCPFPDAYVGEALASSPIDFIFVQFYNNYCGMQTWTTDATNPAFNYNVWDKFVKQSAMNSGSKIFLGVPASPSAAGSGYRSAKDVVEASNYLRANYDSFGGVMMWDASQAWSNIEDNVRFIDAVKSGFSKNDQDYVVPTSDLPGIDSAVFSTIAATSVVVSRIVSLPTTTCKSSHNIVSHAAASIQETTLSKAFEHESALPTPYGISTSTDVKFLLLESSVDTPQVFSSWRASSNAPKFIYTSNSFYSSEPSTYLTLLINPLAASVVSQIEPKSCSPSIATSASSSTDLVYSSLAVSLHIQTSTSATTHSHTYTPISISTFPSVATPTPKHPHETSQSPVIITPTNFRASGSLAGPFYTTLSDGLVQEAYMYYEPDVYVTRYSTDFSL